MQMVFVFGIIVLGSKPVPEEYVIKIENGDHDKVVVMKAPCSHFPQVLAAFRHVSFQGYGWKHIRTVFNASVTDARWNTPIKHCF